LLTLVELGGHEAKAPQTPLTGVVAQTHALLESLYLSLQTQLVFPVVLSKVAVELSGQHGTHTLLNQRLQTHSPLTGVKLLLQTQTQAPLASFTLYELAGQAVIHLLLDQTPLQTQQLLSLVNPSAHLQTLMLFSKAIMALGGH